MRTRFIGLIAGVLVGGILALATLKPVHAGYSISCWRRTDAVDYAWTALGEGYSWGGGWWNNNDYDDTPGSSNPNCTQDNSTNQVYSPSCEGPDCAGFTFKSWAMHPTEGNSTPYYWYIDEASDSYNTYFPSLGIDEKGPYHSSEFRDGCSGACTDVCGSGTGSACGSGSYSLTQWMDVFAKNGHVAPIYVEDSSGYDYVMEGAFSSPDTYGLIRRTYRLQAAYDGVKRNGWCN